MPIPALSGGVLPVGRHPATEAEVEARFVSASEFGESTTRQDIWHDWTMALGAAQALMQVCAVWIGGSFATSALNPDDLDAVLILDRRRIDALAMDPTAQRALSAFANGGVLRSQTGWRVDTYVLPWVADPQGEGLVLGVNTYLEMRGYWDDFRSHPSSLASLGRC